MRKSKQQVQQPAPAQEPPRFDLGDEGAVVEPSLLPPPPAEDETPVERPTPRAVAKAKEPARWRVTREAVANVNGAFTRLVEGQVLDPLGYSESTIESLRAQGVALDPVE